MSQTQLASAIGISSGTLSDWLSGRYYPRTKHIEAMSEFFNIPTEDLVAEKKTPSSVDDEALSLDAVDHVYCAYIKKEGGESLPSIIF